MCVCCFHYRKQLAQYAVVNYLKVSTHFIFLDSGKFNTTVVIARVIYHTAKEKSNHFGLSHCWLRLFCDFKIPRIFTNANMKFRPVTRPQFGSIQFRICSLYYPTVQFIVNVLFSFSASVEMSRKNVHYFWTY